MMDKQSVLFLGIVGLFASMTGSACLRDADIGRSSGSSSGTSSGEGGSGGAGGGSSSSGDGGTATATTTATTTTTTTSTTSTGTGGLFSCGTKTCDAAAEFCQVVLPGVPGDPSYACKPLPAGCQQDPTCGCLEPFACEEFCPGGRGCGESCTPGRDGGLTATCALP